MGTISVASVGPVFRNVRRKFSIPQSNALNSNIEICFYVLIGVGQMRTENKPAPSKR